MSLPLGTYNETYGSLGAVIGFMTWIWPSAMVVLLGAEINAETEHQTAHDTTPNPRADDAKPPDANHFRSVGARLLIVALPRVDSFLSAAFSSERVVLRSFATAECPSSPAHEMRVP